MAYSIGKRFSGSEPVGNPGSFAATNHDSPVEAIATNPISFVGDSPLAEILQLSHRHERDDQLALRLRRADAAHMPLLLAEALALPPSARRDDVLAAIFERWGAIAPLAGLAATENLTPLQRERFAKAVRTGWVRTDPEGALCWLQAQINVDRYENVIRYQPLISALLDDDRRETVMSLLNVMRDDDLKSLAVGEITARWVGQDAAAALTWVGSLPAGRDRQNLYWRAFQMISFENPAGAADLANALPDSNDRRDALDSVMAVWAGNDAASANAWLVSHSAAPEFQSMVRTFISYSLAKNPDLAASMIDSIQDPKTRASLVSDSIAALASSSPADAVQWTLRFQPPGKREAYLERMFRQWGARDREGAEAFLGSASGLTDEQRARGRTAVRSAAVRR
jgi:hypothetical protein